MVEVPATALRGNGGIWRTGLESMASLPRYPSRLTMVPLPATSCRAKPEIVGLECYIETF